MNTTMLLVAMMAGQEPVPQKKETAPPPPPAAVTLPAPAPAPAALAACASGCNDGCPTDGLNHAKCCSGAHDDCPNPPKNTLMSKIKAKLAGGGGGVGGCSSCGTAAPAAGGCGTAACASSRGGLFSRMKTKASRGYDGGCAAPAYTVGGSSDCATPGPVYAPAPVPAAPAHPIDLPKAMEKPTEGGTPKGAGKSAAAPKYTRPVGPVVGTYSGF